jgi:GntR family transcriptional regulator
MSIAIGLSSDAGFPLYQQVRALLLNQIANGEYRVGDRIPTEMALAEQFKTSRITVRQALDSLAQEGLLVRKQRTGTFLAAIPKERRHEFARVQLGLEDIVAELPRRPGFVLRHGLSRPPRIVTEQLRIPPESEVPFFVRVLEAGGGGPRSAVKRYFAPDLAAHITQRVREAANFEEALEGSTGRAVILSKIWVEAILAEPHLILILQAPLGSALLSTWWVQDMDGRPAVVTQSLNSGNQIAARCL